MKIRVIIIIGFFFLAVLNSYSAENKDFLKGFHVGICNTYLTFGSYSRDFYKASFYITNQKGEKIKNFNIEDSIYNIKLLYASESHENRKYAERIIELFEKSITGDIKDKEKFELPILFYSLIFKTDNPEVKFGFLVAQMYTSIVFIDPKVPEEVKKIAYNKLNLSLSMLVFFSSYFFESALSDELYYALISNDLNFIKKISFTLIAKKMNLKVN